MKKWFLTMLMCLFISPVFAIEFHGTEYINTNDLDLGGELNASVQGDALHVSLWFKTSTSENIFLMGGANEAGADTIIQVEMNYDGVGNRIRILMRNESNKLWICAEASPSITINDGNWHNAIFSIDINDDTCGIWLDGNSESATVDYDQSPTDNYADFDSSWFVGHVSVDDNLHHSAGETYEVKDVMVWTGEAGSGVHITDYQAELIANSYVKYIECQVFVNSNTSSHYAYFPMDDVPDGTTGFEQDVVFPCANTDSLIASDSPFYGAAPRDGSMKSTQSVATFWDDACGSSVCAQAEVSGEMRWTLTTDNQNSEQMLNDQFDLDASTDWDLFFNARESENGHDIRNWAYIEDDDDYTNYLSSNDCTGDIELTSTDAQYQCNWTTNGSAAGDGRFRFFMENADSSGDIYYFDHIYIVPDGETAAKGMAEAEKSYM